MLQRSLLSKVLLLLLLLFLILAGSVGIYYYAQFSRLLNAKLLSQTPQRTFIYSRPYRVRVGQPISLQALQERLDRIGYRPGEIGDAGDWYQVRGNRIRLGQTDARGRSEEFEITFSGKAAPEGRVTGVRTGERAVPEACLRPEFLSSLFGRSREKKKYVRFEDLPQGLVNAVLAAEDERFFSHHGLDLEGILRAGLVNLRKRDQEPLQGGSTLTQQFVKNYFLTPEQTPKRKLEEACLSLLLETRLSKKEIFELYANSVYLGQLGSFGILGFGQGADAYFGKNVKDLTLEESAFLAGIIQAPNHYSPYHHPQVALQRRNYVFDLMEKKRLLSAREKAVALSAPLAVLPPSRQNYAGAPYFIDYVKEALEREGDDLTQPTHLRVYTTLDIDLQKAAFEAVEEGMAEVDRLLSRRKPPPEPQAALVALDPRSGEVLALVGGRNYSVSQYDRATRALRQPGSTFKPFVYAAALQKGLSEPASFSCTLSSLLMDEPYTFTFGQKAYSPHNYGEKYYGTVTLRQALARSLNIPTVKLAQQVGFDSVAAFARRFGFGEPLLPYPSLALGTFDMTLLDLARGYAVFADGGRAVPLRAVTALKSDETWREIPADRGRPVLRPEVAFLITSALSSVLNEGTGAPARARGFRLPAAGKTGTSDDDSWFVGYTPELLCAVWVGLDDSSPLHLTGARAALPIWTLFMLKAQRLGYLSGAGFSPPENIVAVEIDPRTGLLASDRCEETRTEYYVKDTEPTRACSHYDEANLATLLLETGAPGAKEKKGGGLWGWFKRIFR